MAGEATIYKQLYKDRTDFSLSVNLKSTVWCFIASPADSKDQQLDIPSEVSTPAHDNSPDSDNIKDQFGFQSAQHQQDTNINAVKKIKYGSSYI
jgi:hypothetical protein